MRHRWRLLLVLVIEFAVITLLLIVVGSLVVPALAPPVDVPTVTPAPTST